VKCLYCEREASFEDYPLCKFHTLFVSRLKETFPEFKFEIAQSVGEGRSLEEILGKIAERKPEIASELRNLGKRLGDLERREREIEPSKEEPITTLEDEDKKLDRELKRKKLELLDLWLGNKNLTEEIEENLAKECGASGTVIHYMRNGLVLVYLPSKKYGVLGSREKLREILDPEAFKEVFGEETE